MQQHLCHLRFEACTLEPRMLSDIAPVCGIVPHMRFKHSWCHHPQVPAAFRIRKHSFDTDTSRRVVLRGQLTFAQHKREWPDVGQERNGTAVAHGLHRRPVASIPSARRGRERLRYRHTRRVRGVFAAAGNALYAAHAPDCVCEIQGSQTCGRQGAAAAEAQDRRR
jgi:hypothetical protein